MKNKKSITIIVSCVLCAAFATLAILFQSSRMVPNIENDDPESSGIVHGIYDIGEAQVPLDGLSKQVSAGDIVVVNVFADRMEDVYGYQFNINYDREYIEYSNRLYSDIGEIITIFATDNEQRLLVGATMIGDAKGHSGEEVSVCRVEFVALADLGSGTNSVLEHISISGVNVVTDSLSYLEDIDGWTINASVQ